jgi:hypothetical protein
VIESVHVVGVSGLTFLSAPLLLTAKADRFRLVSVIDWMPASKVNEEVKFQPASFREFGDNSPAVEALVK